MKVYKDGWRSIRMVNCTTLCQIWTIFNFWWITAGAIIQFPFFHTFDRVSAFQRWIKVYLRQFLEFELFVLQTFDRFSTVFLRISKQERKLLISCELVERSCSLEIILNAKSTLNVKQIPIHRQHSPFSEHQLQLNCFARDFNV